MAPCKGATSRYPRLIYCQGKTKKKMFGTINIPDSSSSRIRKIPELHGKDVVASFPGWLLLFDHSNDIYSLWDTSASDPTSSSIHSLPPLKLRKARKGKKKLDTYHYALMFRSGRGLVLVFDPKNPTIFCCRFTTNYKQGGRGEDDDLHLRQWAEIRYDKQMACYSEKSEYHGLRIIEPLVSCNGRLYSMPAECTTLVEVDIVELPSGRYDMSITPLATHGPEFPFRSVRVKKSYLECDGELFMVQSVLGGVRLGELISVSVSKLNMGGGAGVAWEEVGACGMRDKCFFLDAEFFGSGFVLSNVQPRRGGRIYFTEKDCKYVYCFNMEDNSCSVSLPCPDLPTPWRTPVWVMPSRLCGGGEVEDDGRQVEEEELENMLTLNNDVEEEETILFDAKNNNGGTRLHDIHPDVVKCIAWKLMPMDYLNFRASCRTSRLVCPPRHWRSVLADVEDTACLSAWLTFPSADKRWNFLVPNDGRNRFMITSPAPLDKYATVRSSKDGWLLLCCSISQECMVFFNPFTRSLKQLPDLPNDNMWVNGPWVGFTFFSSPDSDELLLVGISWFRNSIRVAIFKPKYDRWLILNFENDNVPFYVNYNNPVFWKGGFYFLGERAQLGVLTETSTDIWEWKVLDKPKPPPCDGFRHNFLVECGGELVSVFVGFMGRNVCVFKLDPATWEWQKVESLGNHVLYMSRSASFCAPSRIKGMEDRIYFPRVYGKSLVFYSLCTGQFFCDGGDRPLQDLCNTEEKLLCGWVEPSWNRSR